MTPDERISGWLPPGKRAAVCLSIDDVHPGRSSDPYEAGGDGEAGCLGHLEWLLERHPSLRATLFITPDWRPISVVPTRPVLAALPIVRDAVYLAPPRPVGSMRLSRHPEFVAYVRGLRRCEAALHGLHHLHRGRDLTTEFQRQSEAECRRILVEAMRIFDEAGLPCAPGFQPPRWNLPPNLIRALEGLGLEFVVSARDLRTPISPGATADMSGLREVSLLYPQWLEDTSIVHFPVNYQATSKLDRATAILDAGGLLSIKGHAIKNLVGYVMKDGLDAEYRDHLHRLFSTIEDRYGDEIWWTSLGGIARSIREEPAEAAHG